MEATARGALLRRVPFAPRRTAGVDGGMTPAMSRPARVKMENKFRDQGHLRYYAAATPGRCGPRKEDKRRMKLVKGLEKDLSALYSMGFDGVKDQDQGQTISEAAELLLAHLTKLRAEAKEMKQRRKQEKAALKAAKMKDRAAAESSSSSESSDSECETIAKTSRSNLRTTAAASDPVAAAAAVQTEAVIKEAKNNNLALNPEPQSCSSSAEVGLKPTTGGKIEVCMGGKCKKSGAMELMAEFERKVGAEGAVVGCKCMGKCRDGPNVRVMNRSAAAGAAGDALMMKIVKKGPLCIGVGLEDVGPIVAEFLGEIQGVGLQPA